MKRLPIHFALPLFKWGLLSLFIILGACQDQDYINPVITPTAPIDLKLYQPQNAGTHQLTSTLLWDTLQVSFFNRVENDLSIGQMTGLYLGHPQDAKEIVMLLDEAMQPAFLYGINSSTGEKENTLIEFEPVSQDSMYLRVFEYQWDQRLSILIAESLIIGNSTTELQFISQYVLDEQININDSIENGRISNKGKIISVPHARLERVEKAGMSFTTNRLQNEHLSDAIDNFRAGYINFVGTEVAAKVETISNIFLAAGVVGGAAVIFGGASTGVAVVSAALIAVGYAGQFISNGALHERVLEFLSGARDNIANFPNSFVEIGENVVEYFDTYHLDISSHWNNLVDDLTLPNLSDLLDRFEEEEVLPDNEELDDLPDSQGVLHISLNWQIPGDIDLHVFDPTGAHIFYGNRVSSIGYLDRDDTRNTGPENIYFADPPDGEYLIQVRHFSGPSPNGFRVGCTDGLGFHLTRSGSVSSHVNVATILVENGRAQVR